MKQMIIQAERLLIGAVRAVNSFKKCLKTCFRLIRMALCVVNSSTLDDLNPVKIKPALTEYTKREQRKQVNKGIIDFGVIDQANSMCRAPTALFMTK